MRKNNIYYFLSLITCYAGRTMPINKLKNQFLNMYPLFKVTEFYHAAKSLLETNLTPKTIFCEMTSLENTSRAAAEAYLNRKALTKGDLDLDTALPSMGGAPSVATATTAPSQLHQRLHLLLGLRLRPGHQYFCWMYSKILQ